MQFFLFLDLFAPELLTRLQVVICLLPSQQIQQAVMVGDAQADQEALD